MCIVGFFSMLINLIFFQQRYNDESIRLQWPKLWSVGRPARFRIPGIETIPATPDIIQSLKQNTIFSSIAHLDDQYIMYRISWDQIKISIVTRLVQAQKVIFWICLLLLIIFSVISYGISHIFVTSALWSLKKLVKYVDTLTINTLDQPVPITGPDHDEIHKIAHALQSMITMLKQQTDSLKDFVTHASHELKTPLMALSATMDVASKTWNYEIWIQKSKNIISWLNNLFETLMLVTKREHSAVHWECDIVHIMQDCIQ